MRWLYLAPWLLMLTLMALFARTKHRCGDARAPSTTARTFKVDATVGPPHRCPVRADGVLEGDFNATWELGRVCFDGFDQRLNDGLRDVMRGLLTEDNAAPMYVARLTARFVGRGATYHFDLRGRSSWSIARAVVAKIDRTTSTARVDNQFDETIRANLAKAEASMLDDIRAAALASSAMQ